MNGVKKIMLPGFFFLSCFVSGQDSLRKLQVRLFDLNVYVGNVVSDPGYSYKEVTAFTNNQAFLNESQGYSTGLTVYSTYSEQFDLGVSTSLQIKSQKFNFVKRLKPSLGLYYCSRTFANEDLSYSRRYAIDTLTFTDPKVSPILIDSVSKGNIRYSYSTQQLLLEIGLHVDILTLKYSNFYVGVLYGQGISLQSTFTVHKSESYTIDKYPGQTSSASGILKSYTLSEAGAQGTLYRVVFPFGYQHRFGNRHNFAIGFFTELRPGFENYKTIQGAGVSKAVISVSGGLRLSLQKHKP